MEFRILNEKEQGKIKKALVFTGSTCMGASYVKDTQTYYLNIVPPHQVTPRLRKKIEGALGTENVVLNGTVI